MAFARVSSLLTRNGFPHFEGRAQFTAGNPFSARLNCWRFEAFFTLQSYSDWFCAVQDIPLLLLPIRF
jgi:hypothetical protein